ncbi:MAG: efflux RND transporter periplasmic adaptor subunit [Pseudomonadota bacterium]
MKIETLPFAPTQPIKSRRRWRAPVIGLLLVLLAGGGWTVMQSKGKAGSAQAAGSADEKADAKVDVYELGSGDVAAIEERELSVKLPLSGSLVPQTLATVKSKVAAVVMETTVQEGMNVTAGQVIARLDQADLTARLAQQQASLEEATARLSLAKKNSVNNQALLKQNYISQNAFDTTQNSVDLAAANVKAVQAQVDLARIALADTQIRAPITGVVSKRHVQAGEKLSPDMPVFTIVNLQQLNLEAQVPAEDIPRIKVGQLVQFKVDGFDGRPFSGTVTRINPTAEAGSRSMLVYISVANADGALRGGMFAKGVITTAKSAVTALVPLAALRKDKDADQVYQVENGKVVARAVTLGMRNEDEGYAEVRTGLVKGNQVIVAKLDGVKPGTKVKLADAKAAAAAPAAAAVAAKKG